MNIIETKNISKSYRQERVLRGFNFEARKGEFILLVGANGSGKTTFLRGLLGLLRFDSGTFSVRSQKIAYVPERFYFPEFVSLEEFMKLALDLKEVAFLLEEWGLFEARKKEFRKLSKGMRQKALLLQALFSDAEILVLDEPLNGIDRASGVKFLSRLQELKAEQKTIILSSHDPGFFRELADRTVIMEVGE